MRARRTESGQILPMAALLMVVILGMAALAIDGSNIYSQHRKLQADLDVAVKVAASQLWNYDPSSPTYTDTVRTAIASAAQILAADGYSNTLTITSSITLVATGDSFCGNDAAAGITICNPPRSGPFAGSPHYDYVEGTLSRDVGGFFGGTIGLGKLHVSVRAVAWHGGFHQPYAIIGLDPSPNTCSIGASGHSDLLGNGSIVGDSQTCDDTSGSASSTGHSDESGSGNTDQIPGNSGQNQSVPLVTDPYTATSVTSITQTETVTSVPGTSATIPPECAAEVNQYLGITSATPPADTYLYFPPADGSPGLSPLTGDITQSGHQPNYNFLPRCDGTPFGQPGIFLQQSVQTPGKVYINSYNSVLVLDSSNSELFHDTGRAVWALSAPISGPYQGIALSQTRSATVPPCSAINTVNFTGTGKNGGFSADGVIDLPCTDVSALGNAALTVNGVLVAYDMATGGNSSVTVTYNPSETPPDKGSVLVE